MVLPAGHGHNAAMAQLLIKLNNIPEDEIEEIRDLLDQNRIDYYETEAGRWGISLAGIWLRDDGQVQEAQRLLHNYQQDRERRVREEYRARLEAGERDNIFLRIMHSPFRVLIYLLAILAVAYLTIMPFMQFFSGVMFTSPP